VDDPKSISTTRGQGDQRDPESGDGGEIDLDLSRRITWLPSGKQTDIAIETGNFSRVFPLKMVIFHSFLYVYQRLNNDYPLLNIQQTMERSTMLSRGKSTNFLWAIEKIAFCMFTRG